MPNQIKMKQAPSRTIPYRHGDILIREGEACMLIKVQSSPDLYNIVSLKHGLANIKTPFVREEIENIIHKWGYSRRFDMEVTVSTPKR